MRHLAFRRDLNAKRALGSDSNLVFRRLAINQKAATHGIFIRDLGAQTVSLFTHQKEHAHGHAFFAQELAGGDLRGDDALWRRTNRVRKYCHGLRKKE